MSISCKRLNELGLSSEQWITPIKIGSEPNSSNSPMCASQFITEVDAGYHVIQVHDCYEYMLKVIKSVAIELDGFVAELNGYFSDFF